MLALSHTHFTERRNEKKECSTENENFFFTPPSTSDLQLNHWQQHERASKKLFAKLKSFSRFFFSCLEMMFLRSTLSRSGMREMKICSIFCCCSEPAKSSARYWLFFVSTRIKEEVIRTQYCQGWERWCRHVKAEKGDSKRESKSNENHSHKSWNRYFMRPSSSRSTWSHLWRNDDELFGRDLILFFCRAETTTWDISMRLSSWLSCIHSFVMDEWKFRKCSSFNKKNENSFLCRTERRRKKTSSEEPSYDDDDEDTRMSWAVWLQLQHTKAAERSRMKIYSIFLYFSIYVKSDSSCARKESILFRLKKDIRERERKSPRSFCSSSTHRARKLLE